MRYSHLAPLDGPIPVLIFGTLRFLLRGAEAAHVDHRAALRRALERGATLVHSSYEYDSQAGLATELARAGAGRDVRHMVKNLVGQDLVSPRQQRGFVELQCRVLGVRALDILQIRAGTWSENERALDYLAPLRREGRVRAIACFTYTAEDMRRALADARIDLCAAYYNPYECGLAPLLPELERAGKPFLAVQPLDGGLFADGRSGPSVVPAGDRFGSAGDPHKLAFRTALRAALGARPDYWARFAVRFCLSSPGGRGLVMGFRTPGRLDDAVSWLDDPPLDEAVLARVGAVRREFAGGSP
jgi:aryl-alcohol dehydrogenase-like predicted oxidoreductase